MYDVHRGARLFRKSYHFVQTGRIASYTSPDMNEYRRAALESAAADAVPIAQGQQSIQMQVNIVWEIE